MTDKPTYEELEQRIKESEKEAVHFHRTKKVLEGTESHYHSFIKNFKGIAYQGDMNFVPIFFHGAVETITGYTEEDFTAGKPRWNQIIHPDDLPKVGKFSDKLRSVPDYSTEREYRIMRKNKTL